MIDALKHIYNSFKQLNFYNSSSPFLIKEDGKYYFFSNPRHTQNNQRFEYIGTEELLFQVISDIKTMTYKEMIDATVYSQNTNNVKEYWQNYVNYMYSGNGGLIFWTNPELVWKDELCRRGKLLCDSCNTPMTMYYNPCCFKCNKPEKNKDGFVMFLPACHYLSHKYNIDYDTIKKSFQSEHYGNDSEIEITPEIGYAELLFTEFPNCKFFISW